MTLRWSRTRPERVEPGEAWLVRDDSWPKGALGVITAAQPGAGKGYDEYYGPLHGVVEPPESDWDVIERFVMSKVGNIHVEPEDDPNAKAWRRLRAKHEEKSE